LLDQLHSLGYDTITAVDGPSAVTAAFEQHPDLCILDVSMPAGDLGVDDRSTGFEVCRRIKRDPRTSRIPVIFVTALNDTTDRVRAIEAGGDDFLTKPHNRHILGARVRSLLKLKAATDARLDGDFVICSWHGWTFNLTDGRCRFKDWACLELYPVRLRDGFFEVELPVGA